MKRLTGIAVLIVLAASLLYFVARHNLSRQRGDELAFTPLSEELAAVPVLRNAQFGPKAESWAQSEAWIHAKCNWIFFDNYASAALFDRAQPWHAKLLANTQDLLSQFGLNAHYWLGVELYSRFMRCFQSNDDDCAKELLDCEEKLDAKLDLADAAESEFLQLARKEQLIDEAGKIKPESLAIVELLFRYIWIKTTADIIDEMQLLLPEERRLIIRWQIEQSSLSVEQKLRLIEINRIKFEGLYDYDFATAVLLKESGDLEGARKSLEAARDAAKLANNGKRVAQLDRYLLSINLSRQ
ncbi:MAG: hypothetical protein WC966_02040 [Bradymonadales bacterium]|jgi:hypothetical protein